MHSECPSYYRRVTELSRVYPQVFTEAYWRSGHKGMICHADLNYETNHTYTRATPGFHSKPQETYFATHQDNPPTIHDVSCQ